MGPLPRPLAWARNTRSDRGKASSGHRPSASGPEIAVVWHRRRKRSRQAAASEDHNWDPESQGSRTAHPERFGRACWKRPGWQLAPAGLERSLEKGRCWCPSWRLRAGATGRAGAPEELRFAEWRLAAGLPPRRWAAGALPEWAAGHPVVERAWPWPDRARAQGRANGPGETPVARLRLPAAPVWNPGTTGALPERAAGRPAGPGRGAPGLNR